MVLPSQWNGIREEAALKFSKLKRLFKTQKIEPSIEQGGMRCPSCKEWMVIEMYDDHAPIHFHCVWCEIDVRRSWSITRRNGTEENAA